LGSGCSLLPTPHSPPEWLLFIPDDYWFAQQTWIYCRKPRKRPRKHCVLGCLAGAICMSKIAIYPALLSIFLATGCAFFEQQPPPTAPAKTSAERITVHGLSRDIISEARQIATEHCKEQDRRFTFLRNAFRKKTWLGIDWLTCDLYFPESRIKRTLFGIHSQVLQEQPVSGH